MTMTNRTFAFLAAAALIASPLYVSAHGDETHNERTDQKERKLLDFRGEGKLLAPFDKPLNTLRGEGKNFIRGNAEAGIDARIANLERLIDRIEASERLSEDQQDRLIAGIEAQIDLLQNLQVRIENGESRADIKTDLRLSLKGKVHAMPKGAIETAAERVLTIVDRTEDLADRLENRMHDAQNDGENVSVSLEAHEDLEMHLATARAEADAAIDLVAKIDLDTEDDDVIAENRRILVAAKDNIKDAYEALKAAREEIRIILVDLDIEAKAAVE